MTRFNLLGRLLDRLRRRSGESAVSPARKQRSVESSETYTDEQLQEFLHCWSLPGGTLPPQQARALLAWSGTPSEERKALKASIAATEQQVEARPLAPNERRGHVGLVDRVKHVLGR